MTFSAANLMVSYYLTHESPGPPASDIFLDMRLLRQGRNFRVDRVPNFRQTIQYHCPGLGILSTRRHKWDRHCLCCGVVPSTCGLIPEAWDCPSPCGPRKGSSLKSKKQIKLLLGTRDGRRANGFLFWPVSEFRKPAFPWILLEIQCPKNKVPLSPKLNPDGFYPLVTEESLITHSGSC